MQGFDALLDTGVQLPPGLQHATRDRSAPAPLAGALQALGFKNSADWHCAAGLTSLFGPLAEFRTQINGIARRQIVRLVVEPGRGD